jgi:hypothetical protein
MKWFLLVTFVCSGFGQSDVSFVRDNNRVYLRHNEANTNFARILNTHPPKMLIISNGVRHIVKVNPATLKQGEEFK